MPTYVWKGKTLSGDVQSGELTVGSQDEVLAHLRKKRIIATFVREKPKGVSLSLKLRGSSGVKTKDLAVFTRQFATMINSGLALVQCLDILAQQQENAAFKVVITNVMHDVESGSTLAEALRRHPKVFDKLFCNMVEAGEAGGVLDDILLRLASYIEKAEALRRKVKSAMTYPLVVLTVAVGATVFMLVFIIPTFAKIFTEFGGDLPVPTKVVLGLSNFLRSSWYILLGGTAAAIVAYRRYVATEAGRRKIDALKLRIPILGDVLRKGAIARFTRTLGTLIMSGVPLLKAIEISGKVVSNSLIRLDIDRIYQQVKTGKRISQLMREGGIFPVKMIQMVTLGEETGQIGKMLETAASELDRTIEIRIKRYLALVEPIAILLMGLIIGAVVISMLSAILGINDITF